jgi:hypothetical protein
MVLCVPRLDGEMGMTMRQEDGFNWPFCSAAEGDHFGGVNEMILDSGFHF